MPVSDEDRELNMKFVIWMEQEAERVANQLKAERQKRGTRTMSRNERIVRVGSGTQSAALRECRGLGCDREGVSEPLRGVQAGTELESFQGNGTRQAAGRREDSSDLPQEGPRGLDGDRADVAVAGPVHDAGSGTEAYSTGAVRSYLGPRYDLVPSAGVRRVAEAMAHGASKYGENNWMKGMPLRFLLNHAMAHIYNFLEGDRSEDHLGHAAANLLMACHSYEQWPNLNPGMEADPPKQGGLSG